LRELARRELARRCLLNYVQYNFPTYKISWHHKLLAEKLEAVERGDIKRLIVTMPPRHGKSELVSIQFPPWIIGKNKDRNIIQASYASDLAMDFGRQVRNQIADPHYQNLFDVTLAEDSKAKGKWNTNGRGAYNAVGIGGAVTGKGADFLIIDDYCKNRQDAESSVIRESTYEWYTSTARTRLSPDGAIIILATRWHDDDLIGRILKKPDADKWEVINLPAIAIEDEQFRKQGEALWADHFTLDSLKEIKADIGTYDWSSLYQCSPLDADSQEFKKEMFQYKEPNQIPDDTKCWITIDPAVKEHDSADYTGIIINRVDLENNWYIKSQHERINSAKLIDKIFELWRKERPEAIGIEETTYYDAVYPFLKLEMIKRNIFPIIYGLKHHGTKKETRIRGLIPRYEGKKIFHLVGQCDALEEEELRFPKGINDDILDALAYQEQICKPPVAEKTYIEDAIERMSINSRTGYFN